MILTPKILQTMRNDLNPLYQIVNREMHDILHELRRWDAFIKYCNTPCLTFKI